MERNLEYIVNHVFLPPKLPPREDSSREKSIDLTSAVLDALNGFESTQPLSERPIWARMMRMIQSLQDSGSGKGSMSPEKINNMLMTLVDGGRFIFTLKAHNLRLTSSFFQMRSHYTSSARMQASSSAEPKTNTYSKLLNFLQLRKQSWAQRAD
jgi:hypothetical protein